MYIISVKCWNEKSIEGIGKYILATYPCAEIPRPEGEAGYREKIGLAHTPPGGIGGVWGEEKACPYPARRARQGMERRKGLLIPRPEG